MDWLKAISDRLLLLLLKATSGFEKELTRAGRAEQAMWRERRLRNLKGLALRSRQRADAKEPAKRDRD